MVRIHCDSCSQQFQENEATHDIFIPISGQIVHRRPIPGTGQGVESMRMVHFCDFECMRDWSERKADGENLEQ